ncbi:MAG: hypothetical protein WDZ51_19225 [Pirellulaceae bacterium]
MSFGFDLGLRARILAHLVGVIEAVELQRDPFPHVCAEGFLPQDVFAELLDRLPNPEIYEPFSYDKHKSESGETTRRRLTLKNASLGKLSEDDRRFWYTVRSALGAVELKRAIYAKLAPGLACRYGVPEQDAAELPGFASPDLFHETSGYQIKPHPDTRRKVVTMQIALPNDRSREDLGTEFYRRSMNPGSWLREPRGFELVRSMPFLPNAFYAFTVLNTVRLKSWHGRTKVRDNAGPRDSILNIWYENPENGNPDLVRENEELVREVKTVRSAA